MKKSARPEVTQVSAYQMSVNCLSIDVIVPVYNKVQHLAGCLESVLRAAEDAPDIQVTVVDHGSTDGSTELARSICDGRARFLVSHGGTIGELRNRAASLGRGQIVSFFDSDVVVPRGYFRSLRSILERQAIAATGCRVDYPTDGPWVERVWNELHAPRPSEGFRGYLNSGNFSVRRSAFEAVGGFSDTLVTGEDSDIGRRLNARGLRIWESPRLGVLHVDNPTSIRAFFRKEVWHALGQYSIGALWPPARVVLVTFMHLIFTVAAMWWLIAGSHALVVRLSASLVLLFTVPMVAVTYRMIQSHRMVSWLPAIVLYQVYFVARIAAAISPVRRFYRQSRGSASGILRDD